MGESVRVQVQLYDPATDVSINGVYGGNQFLQFRSPGTFTVVVTAALGKHIEQVGERVKVSILNPDIAKLPLFGPHKTDISPHHRVFHPNAENELSNVRAYTWNFGDGTSGVSETGGIGHDYTDSLERDSLYTNFDVQIDAHFARQLFACRSDSAIARRSEERTIRN